MGYNRAAVVGIMQSWMGRNEAAGTHKYIIDLYNQISPLPLGYKLKYTDAWCAGTVSAAYHAAGYDKIFPSECSCPRMVTKAKQMGIWVEDDNHTPLPGDCILYDWQDGGVGDNTGEPDHIGMVERVVGNQITVIEGNMANAVGRRTIAIGGKNIRGYVCPRFADEPVEPGWKDSGNRQWYQRADGSYPKNEWEQIGGAWYWFDEDGYLVKNSWVSYKGQRYYVNGFGRMAVGGALEVQQDGSVLPVVHTIDGTGDTPSKWAKEATEWAKGKGLFAGNGKGDFGWQETVTREQLAQVLYNLFGKGDTGV